MRIGNCSICLLISIHTPHIGSDIVRHMIYAYLTNFNPRSTHRERRCLPLHHSHCPLISIHAPRRGERPTSFAMVANCTPFQSTLPAWGATWLCPFLLLLYFYFNPRSPHGERPGLPFLPLDFLYFNPRSPHGERRSMSQVRLSSWQYFNPRSPHGERPPADKGFDVGSLISIHAPRMGSDIEQNVVIYIQQRFQSTLPAWGATDSSYSDSDYSWISIHAPRMGSDRGLDDRHRVILISIHAPRMGSDDNTHNDANRQIQFQSTLPAWGATVACLTSSNTKRFQSTLPAWGATYSVYDLCSFDSISIHAPRMGSDDAPAHYAGRNPISIHAPRMGSDFLKRLRKSLGDTISIHAPRMGSDLLLNTVSRNLL